MVHGESSQSKHVTIGNPAPIVDMATGRVHMLFSRNNKEVGVLSSDDNVSLTAILGCCSTPAHEILRTCGQGLTWSAVRELTETLMKPTNLTTIFTGLSAGLTLDPSFGHGNRLLVCANHDGPDAKHAKDKNHGRYSSSVFSDDAGATWKMGENVGPPGSTECNLATSREGVFMYTRMWDQGGSPLKTCKRDAVWFCAKPLTI